MRPRRIIFDLQSLQVFVSFQLEYFFLPMARVTALVLFHGLGLCLVLGLGSLTSLVLNMTKRATSVLHLSVFYPSDNKN